MNNIYLNLGSRKVRVHPTNTGNYMVSILWSEKLRYTNRVRFSSHSTAKQFANKVQELGYINTNSWDENHLAKRN